MAEGKKEPRIRHCKMEDKERVMDIGLQYGGLDYIPAVYGIYSQDPFRIQYILEVDGSAAAFLVATMTDEGKAVVFQAARTRPEHRNLGFQTQLKDQAFKEVKLLYPSVKEVLWIGISCSANISAEYRISGGRRILFTQSISYFSLDTPEDVEAASSALKWHPDLVESVQRVDFKNFSGYAQQESFRKLVDGNRVNINWVPYRLDIASNFAMKQRFPDSFGLSRHSNGDVDGVSFFTNEADDTRTWQRLLIDVVCNNGETLLKHVGFNLETILKQNRPFRRKVEVLIMYPLGLKKDFDALLEKTFAVSGELPHETFRYATLFSETGYFDK